MTKVCTPTSPGPCCTLDISGEEQERLEHMFKALGNPKRFAIMKYLVTHEGCMTNDVVHVLPIAQATVSQHLKVLCDTGWLHKETHGTATCYHLDAHNINWFKKKIGEIF